jgi:hypothetical protein
MSSETQKKFEIRDTTAYFPDGSSFDLDPKQLRGVQSYVEVLRVGDFMLHPEKYQRPIKFIDEDLKKLTMTKDDIKKWRDHPR